MEIEPQTENGKRLFNVLTNWMDKYPTLVVGDLKRILYLCSLKLKNGDEYYSSVRAKGSGQVTSLFGTQAKSLLTLHWASIRGIGSLLGILSIFSQSLKFQSTLLRVQHAMEVSLNKRCAKELVVALEISRNQRLLMEILSWTQKIQVIRLLIYFITYWHKLLLLLCAT